MERNGLIPHRVVELTLAKDDIASRVEQDWEYIKR
jgi:hypothetical protein